MSMPPILVHDLLMCRGDGGESDTREAIIDGERTLIYRELRKQVEHLAGRLIDAGLQRGDRVGIFLPKCIAECIAIFATSRADAVFVPINPSLRPAQVAHILADCSARAIISSSTLLSEFSDALASLSELTIRLAVGEETGAAYEPPKTLAIGEDLAAILYTSGSTGRPKGVMLSHRNLVAGTRIVRTYLSIAADDRLLSVLPFSFDYGLNQLLTAVEQRATLILCDFVIGDQIVKALARHRVTGLAGVPTIWALLTRAAPSLRRIPLPHLRYITNSGGALASATIKRLRELLPHTEIFLMYGLTEAFRSTYLPPEEIDRRPRSIGKAIPECEIFAVTEYGGRARPGEAGILVHRGPTVSLGYWNRPDDTARVFKPNPLRPANLGGDTVCYSGDMVVEDEEGYFYFVARNDAMIKSCGHRISPTEVEEVLMESGALHQVAVIGLPDEWSGQRVHAVAVAGKNPVNTEALLRQAAAKLPPYMVPQKIELVDCLPVSPNGKVDYKKLASDRHEKPAIHETAG